MGIVVGIDIGGSTTKIAGFDKEAMLKSVQISASNAIASLFGAFGKFLYDNKLSLEDIEQVNLTGVGCSVVDQPIYGLPTYKVDEFTANGVGGGYFAQGKKEFMVVSFLCRRKRRNSNALGRNRNRWRDDYRAVEADAEHKRY